MPGTDAKTRGKGTNGRLRAGPARSLSPHGKASPLRLVEDEAADSKPGMTGDDSTGAPRSNSTHENRAATPFARMRIDSDSSSRTINSPPAPNMGQPIDGPTDPRWVLAVRAAEALEGAILRPEKRDRLTRLGKLLGLSAFDANLVIAIVQDQARRGYAPQYCPSAGARQLTMVPLPTAPPVTAAERTRRILRIASVIAALIAVELFVFKWLFT